MLQQFESVHHANPRKKFARPPSWFMVTALMIACNCFALGISGAIAAPADPAKRAFALDVVKRQVVGGIRTLRVAQGERVAIRWTADEAMMIHIHGYDAEVRITPGTAADMNFAAYAAGRFPVEAHALGTAAESGKHRRGTTLLYLEVHPR